MKPILYICSFVLLAHTALAQPDLSQNLSDQEKLMGLSQFWSEAKYNFAYFDQTEVEWDSAYYAFIPQVLETNNSWEYFLKLKEFSALLRDGHTDVYSPPGIFTSTIYKPLQLKPVNDRIFVSNVMLRDKGKIPIGSELVQIEGMNAKKWFRDNIYKYIGASTEHERINDAIRNIYYLIPDTVSSLDMTFKSPDDGELFDYAFRYRKNRKGWIRTPNPRQRYHFEIKNDIAYVQINTFGTDSVVYDFRRDLPKIKQAKGVVIDLRKNGGGSTGNGDQILMHFTDADTLVGSAWKTRQHLATYKAWGWYFRREYPDVPISSEELNPYQKKIISILENDYWYDGGLHKAANITDRELKNMPLVVLISNGTASAAEDFLVTLRQLPDRDIPVIGQPSFGSTGQPLPMVLPGEFRARICAKRDTFRDGTDFVGSGIIPDEEIYPTVYDMINDRDVVLERALEIVKNR